MKKKRKNRKVEKKSNFEKKIIFKEKRKKLAQKKEKNIVDYCCNPQCFVCGGTVIPQYHLEYVVMYLRINNKETR